MCWAQLDRLGPDAQPLGGVPAGGIPKDLRGFLMASHGFCFGYRKPSHVSFTGSIRELIDTIRTNLRHIHFRENLYSEAWIACGNLVPVCSPSALALDVLKKAPKGCCSLVVLAGLEAL